VSLKPEKPEKPDPKPPSNACAQVRITSIGERGVDWHIGETYQVCGVGFRV